jgi:hypothetical protein
MSNNASALASQISSQPAIVAIGSHQGINNIYVRPKRPHQIFQPTQTHQNLTNNVCGINSASITPRMRNQQNNQRNPPPGTVNLERSYQICQAVIQNSSNRNLQLNQLNKPPSLNSPKF